MQHSNSSKPSEPQFDCLANSLIQLLETAKQDLERDREAAKALLAKASSILQSEIERRSGANDAGTGGLAGWQIARVRAFIDKNLHGTIHIRDLSAVVRRSAAHFARSFKHSFGEPPHAYVMRRRFEKACHLMIASSEFLSQIALSVDFRTNHIFASASNKRLVKVHPTGGANAKSLASPGTGDRETGLQGSAPPNYRSAAGS